MTAKLNLLLLAVLAAAAALASGCASAPASIEVPDVVKVQTSASCVDPAMRPQRPQLRSEPDLMLLDRGRRTLALFADWLQLQIYTRKLEAVVEACSRIPR